MGALRRLSVGLLIGGLAACSSSSKPSVAPTTTTTKPAPVARPAPSSFAELADRIITDVPAGYVQQPFNIGDTGPSDLAKAVRDDGDPDADATFRSEGFVRGYQQLWIDADDSQIVVFLYQFRKNAGARRDFDRATELFRTKPPANLHVETFTVPGLPAGRSTGYAASDKTGSGAAAYFTTGVFNVQINVNQTTPNAELSPLRESVTALAQEQLSRL